MVSHANEDFLPKEEGNTVLADALGVDLSQASQIRDYDGKMKFIATAAVEVTGWTLGVVQDKAVVTDLIRQNVIQVVLIGLVLIDSSENMSTETKSVLQSIGKLQQNMRQFRV